MPEDYKDELLTEQEVADLAKVPVNTVRYWRQTGKLRSVKAGRHPRIWLSDFNRLMQKPVKITPSVAEAGEGKNVSTQR